MGGDAATARAPAGALGLAGALVATEKASVVPRLRDALHDLATQSFAHFTIPYRLLGSSRGQLHSLIALSRLQISFWTQAYDASQP